MKAIIEIPEHMIKAYQDILKVTDAKEYTVQRNIIEAIANSVPLPETYGNLIDRNNIKYVFDLTKTEPTYSGKDIEWAINSMSSISLQMELEKIKAEINEYLIASFADDEDFRWFNLCLDTHISELKGENNV